MFRHVYLAEPIRRRVRRGQRAVRALFHHYKAHPETTAGWSLPDDPPWQRAADYVSGMTDQFAMRRAEELSLDS